MNEFDLCVVGLGYVGLPTVAIFAHEGLSVLGVDVSQQRIDAIRQGHSDDAEPGLNDFVEGALASGRLTLALEPSKAQTFIVAVPTPVTPEHGYDNSYVLAAAEAIAPLTPDGGLIVLESTVPPGATEELANQVWKTRKALGMSNDISLHFAHCPERVLPGDILTELYNNDRVVGGVDRVSTTKACELYRIFCKGEIFGTSVRTAELAKVVENSYRDVNIAFANEISLIASRMDVNPFELIGLANQHPRVNILTPGIGVGGHCISVDPWFVINGFPEDATLMRTARDVNKKKTQWVIARLSEAIEAGKFTSVAVLGLTYKPNIGDLRNSPALEILKAIALSLPEVEFWAVEPHISGLPSELKEAANVNLVQQLDTSVQIEAMIRLVDHEAFEDTLRTACELAEVDVIEIGAFENSPWRA